MIRAAWTAVVAAMLLLGAEQADAQSTQYKGTCEDIFVPAYPAPGDAGTAIEDLVKMPPEMLNRAAVDCTRRSRVSGRDSAPSRTARIAEAAASDPRPRNAVTPARSAASVVSGRGFQGSVTCGVTTR